MGDNPRITDYITPAPPFFSPGDAFGKVISEIWKKRQDDEQLRIQAAQQAATQSYQQGELGNVRDAHAETRRHQMAAEAHDMGVLDKDRTKQDREYYEKILGAYNAGNSELGAGLGLFGLPAQAMAAPVAGDPNAATAGPEPGMNIPVTPAPNTGTAIAGGQPMTPPVTPQDATAIGAAKGQPPPTAQPELNTPQPPAPAQAAPAAPSTSGPVPTPGSPAPVPPAAPAPSMPPPDAQTRREDIHISPKPPGQLGMEAPIAPGTPAALPPMPYAGDPKRNPIALGAEPGRDADVPTGPGAVPTPGPSGPPGGAPAGPDRQWFNRGAAGTAALGQQIVEGNARRVHDALEKSLMGSARDAVEEQFARSAIAAGAAAARVESPEKAYDDAVKRFQSDVDRYNKNIRNTESAGASKGKADTALQARRDQQYVASERKALEAADIKTVISRHEAVKEMQALAFAPSGPADGPIYENKIRAYLGVMKNKGVVTDADIRQGAAEDHTAWIDRLSSLITTFLSGGGGTIERNLDAAVATMAPIISDQARINMEARARHVVQNAPSPEARDQALNQLESYSTGFDWAPALFDEARHGRLPPERKRRHVEPKPEPKPKANSASRPPPVGNVDETKVPPGARAE